MAEKLSDAITPGNVITATRTYATYANAETALLKLLMKLNLTPSQVRWLIAVSPIDGRFVPTVLMDNRRPDLTMTFVHNGVMVIG